ncbi:hypothetical protein ABPG75_009724 [Micractinium tetrahymenae]
MEHPSPLLPAPRSQPETELEACASLLDLPDEVDTGCSCRPSAATACGCRCSAACHKKLPCRNGTPRDFLVQVLALVVSVGLEEARDVASFAATSRRCLAIGRSAPLRLRLLTRPADTAQEEQAAARRVLQALCAAWPGVAELDLRGSPLEDGDVLTAARMPALAALQLSGCKKLTPAGCSALLSGAATTKLRSVCLQRCFQLTAGALADVLAAAAAPGARLVAAALSHLSLADWPEHGALPGGRLRILALHNSTKLSPGALAAIAAACPRLEVLMLGGCSLVVEEFPASNSSPAQPETAVDGAGSGGGLDAAPFAEAALAAVLGSMPGGGSRCSYVTYLARLAASLAAAVARLPQLRVLELTFALPGLAPAVQRLMAIGPLLLAGWPEPVQVWDLCTPASVDQAVQWRRSVAAAHTAGTGSLTPRDAAAFLAAAVNCSSAGRATPLHAAAEEGDAAQLQALLGLGAVVDARDRSGATPLFLACEAGKDRSVQVLLGANAAINVRNAADETPLYISALKGHERCVELLIQHCQAAGISWQSQRLYGHDGWTPLMAAAVGGRTPIVLKLLEAAGQEAPALVQQATRGGQNCLHLAARKACPSILRSLVNAGGTAPLLAADADGRLPADIAKRNNNGSALRVLADAGVVHAAALRREHARQRGTQPTAERPRQNDHRQQHPPQRWVGRRLQQRKGSGGGGGISGGQ